MPESTDVFVITRNGHEALLDLGYFLDHEVAADMCFAMNCEVPDGNFDILRISFAGDGECCGECDCCVGDPAESVPVVECIGAADPTCQCDDCLVRWFGL